MSYPTPQKRQRPYQKSHRKRNIFLTVLAILAAVALALWLALNIFFGAKINRNSHDSGMVKERNVQQLLKDKKPFSMLVMGTDTGALNRDDKGRTDSMMLVIVNPKAKQTTMISIPRDALVAVDGASDPVPFPQKINAAYTFGSEKSAMTTVQKYLNVPIDFYGIVNMGALEKMVDTVGGVKVASPLDFTYQPDDDKPEKYRFTKGQTDYEYAKDGTNFKTYHTMDGDAALAFSRMRKEDPQGDYGRQQRQRLVIESLLHGSTSATDMIKLIGGPLSDNYRSDLNFDEVKTIGFNYLDARKKIVSENLHGTELMTADGEGNLSSFQIVSQTEKQRVTDLAREALDMDKAPTGTIFGGTVPSDAAAQASEIEQKILALDGSGTQATAPAVTQPNGDEQ